MLMILLRPIIPVIVGVLLTAIVTTMGVATNTLFAVYADTQVIRAEMSNNTYRIEQHENRILKIEDRLYTLEVNHGKN